MIKNQMYLQTRREIILILLLCFACHWMLLLNNGFFWDDNVYYGLIQGKHYEEFSSWILETGLPINILFFRGLDLLVGITNHRWVSFGAIFLSAILLNDLFKRSAGEFKSLSLVFTTLYLTLFPFKSTVLLCTTVYQVMLLFFILGVYIRVRYGAHEATRVRVSALLAFSVLSFISFNTASILVLFYFYLTFEYFYSQGFAKTAWAVPSIWAYVRRNFLVLSLPIIYWGIKNAFFQTHGEYVNYNKISLDLKLSWDSGRAFFSGIVTNGPLHNVLTKTQTFLPLILLMFLALTAFPRAWIFARFQLPAIKMRRVLLLSWSIVFLIISALPYTLVHQWPRFQGWESRHYILFTLSLPTFVLVLVSVYLDRIKEIANMRCVSFIFRPLILSIALIGVVSSNFVYVDYQLLAIKQWAVVENLRARPELKRYSSFRIEDRVGDFSKAEFTWYEANHQAWVEWGAVFTRAWGVENWYGNNVNEREEYTKGVRYSAANINPSGPKCKLTFTKSSPHGKATLVGEYWKWKYFGTEAQLRDYLLLIVEMESCLDDEGKPV